MKAFRLYIILLILGLYSCERVSNKTQYLTKNVIIVVIDGVRYSETWGDSTFINTPKLKLLSESGVVLTNFFNNGPTYTTAGHVSLTTGNYGEINNAGLQIPEFPSMFQYYNKEFFNISTISRIFSSKDKLSILSDCTDLTWNGYYRPLTDCGIYGLGVGSGYRHDSITLKRALNGLKEEHPGLVLISFREPDYSAHLIDWPAYLEGIRETDDYVFQIWNFIKENEFYKGQTALFVTNDHGRHLDSISDGFASHGDNCEGCRHISLLAIGPDFKQGQIFDTEHELIDIPATISEILKFPMPSGQGRIMWELLK